MKPIIPLKSTDSNKLFYISIMTNRENLTSHVFINIDRSNVNNVLTSAVNVLNTISN